MKKSIKLSALLATLLLTSTAFAANQGYAQADGSPVVKNAYGECWKLPTTYDKARDGLVECGDREAAKPAPAPAPKPAPAPVVVAPKPQTVIKTVSLSAEGLFGFNSAQIIAGNQQLEALVSSLKADKMLKTVAVEGHTDYLGSDKYNQALSEKRANAVKDYFVAAGVPADKVTAVGKGETEAKLTAECTAKKFKKRADLIACLAGDRRFDVTVETAKEVQQ
ncbi:OmpA family protein [Vogesella mureinivorans]|jgi:outer membrane protein OmpA-like peptidoglycan-associated protein|uniref:OmpA family protein n=1 Tax=Vogesella mureinivorans TaxID=657276 RepID=UPI0011C82D26|nr:OmpA family protein [Vogesella mureinivorans]